MRRPIKPKALKQREAKRWIPSTTCNTSATIYVAAKARLCWGPSRASTTFSELNIIASLVIFDLFEPKQTDPKYVGCQQELLLTGH